MTAVLRNRGLPWMSLAHMALYTTAHLSAISLFLLLPPYRAAIEKDVVMARVLLQHGARALQPCKMGGKTSCPLRYTRERGEQEMLQVRVAAHCWV